MANPTIPTDDPPGSIARRAALQALDAVLRRGETLDQALVPALRRVEGAGDRALTHAIAAETLRWLVDYDALIDSATRARLADDAKPRMVLRMMLAQALQLGTPPHAVIATALPLLSGGPRRLAHGVFSTLIKRGVGLPDAPTLPPAVAARWGDRAPAIAAALAEPPPPDATLRDPGETDALADELAAIAVLAPGRLRLLRGTAVTELPGFAEGRWWVQDFAASLPATLLGPGEGRRVLDLCAAPGGKALQLAAAGWHVTALDMSDKRLGRLRQNLARTGLAAEIVVADALAWEPAEPFDAILIDAPCSATGTCRRNPDVLHRIGARQIDELAQLQRRLTARAAGWLVPGGRLVYAVCSLEREEAEDQPPPPGLDPDPILPHELPADLPPTRAGWLRTDPSMWRDRCGLDGFFASRWRRPA